MNSPLKVEVPPTTIVDLPSMADAGRVGVLVLGMHRSGTSALARMLNLLGCTLPLTPMPAAFDNPEGHWESHEAMRFNNELLTLAGSAWDDWLPVGEGFFTAPGYSAHVGRGAELLRGEFGDAPLFVFKDPRNCRLVRFWLDVFAAEGITPAVAIPIRNPLEVARSLARRDQADEHYGPLLWLRHVLDAEAASRGLHRVFTSYDQLIDCWEIVADRLQTGLGITWPRMSPATQEEIGAYIDKRHQREHATTEAILNNPLVSGWVRGTYSILARWVADGEDSRDYAELDAITRAFDDAAPAFARLILHGTQARHRVSELEAEVVPLQAEAARAAELETALGQAHTRVNEVEAQLVPLEAAAAGAVQLAAALVQAELRVTESAAQATLLHATLTRAAELETALEQTVLRIAEIEAQALSECETLQHQVDKLTRFVETARGDSLAQVARIAELEWLLGEARARLETAGDQLQNATDRLAEHSYRIAEQNDRIAEQADHIARQDNRFAEQSNRIAEQESALIQRREENEQAWATLAKEQLASSELQGRLDGSRRYEETQRQQLADAEARLISLADAEQRLAQQCAEVARLDALLLQSDHDRDAAEKRARESGKALFQLEQESQSLLARQVTEARQNQTKADTRRNKLELAQAERYNEIATLTRLLRTGESEANARSDQIKWLRRTQMVLQATPYWWALMSRKWRRQRELRLLQRRQIFDSSAYLDRYPDVAASDIDPLTHYIRHGMDEQRSR